MIDREKRADNAQMLARMVPDMAEYAGAVLSCMSLLGIYTLAIHCEGGEVTLTRKEE